jgi:Ni/Co efflux regulator RcnB
MRVRQWLGTGLLMAIALCGMGTADDHGHGKHHDRDDDDDHRQYYSDHDRDEMRDWYHDHDHDNHLPPGLAKRDQLPPGLEKQLRVRGTLPPGLRKKMAPCPEELERRLPPPPVGCAHVVIGGHVVLVNRSTYLVMDIFHFER